MRVRICCAACLLECGPFDLGSDGSDAHLAKCTSLSVHLDRPTCRLDGPCPLGMLPVVANPNSSYAPPNQRNEGSAIEKLWVLPEIRQRHAHLPLLQPCLTFLASFSKRWIGVGTKRELGVWFKLSFTASSLGVIVLLLQQSFRCCDSKDWPSKVAKSFPPVTIEFAFFDNSCCQVSLRITMVCWFNFVCILAKKSSVNPLAQAIWIEPRYM